jgi:hypothetical protein
MWAVLTQKWTDRRRRGVISTGACYMSMAGGALVYGTSWLSIPVQAAAMTLSLPPSSVIIYSYFFSSRSDEL